MKDQLAIFIRILDFIFQKFTLTVRSFYQLVYYVGTVA